MKIKDKKIIDIEKHHKNKSQILMDLNEAKLQSPIILIDPTYKQRNVLAALSEETFKNFQESCRQFLKNPSINFFRQKSVNVEEKRKNAISKGYEFVSLEISTNKQEGDIAGSKLLKFYRHLKNEAEKFYDIKESGFEYKKGKIAKCFLVVKRKSFILITGPEVSDKENVARFRMKHRKILIKNNRLYSKHEITFQIKRFIQNWKYDNRKKMKDMDITSLKILD